MYPVIEKKYLSKLIKMKPFIFPKIFIVQLFFLGVFFILCDRIPLLLGYDKFMDGNEYSEFSFAYTFFFFAFYEYLLVKEKYNTKSLSH